MILKREVCWLSLQVYNCSDLSRFIIKQQLQHIRSTMQLWCALHTCSKHTIILTQGWYPYSSVKFSAAAATSAPGGGGGVEGGAVIRVVAFSVFASSSSAFRLSS